MVVNQNCRFTFYLGVCSSKLAWNGSLIEYLTFTCDRGVGWHVTLTADNGLIILRLSVKSGYGTHTKRPKLRANGID